MTRFDTFCAGVLRDFAICCYAIFPVSYGVFSALTSFAARARNEFDVLIQVVRGETLVSCFPELQEEGVAEVLLTAKTFGRSKVDRTLFY